MGVASGDGQNVPDLTRSLRKGISMIRSWTKCVVVTSLLHLVIGSAWADDPVMRAHYIDVGQGAATLLEFPCGCMLIDTGAQSEQHVDHLVAYLHKFFERRDDLHATIDVVVITHPHKDHTWGLREVAQSFNIRHFVDNGVFKRGSGKANVNWLRKRVENGMLHTAIREIADDEITSLPHKQGLSDDAIDPFRCEDCDPQVRILSGRLDESPGWSKKEFENLNNHSVVVRVDFGESSFLFTGDLEEPAIQTMVSYYRNTDMLDVDVYQVGHHGSHNGTNEALLEAMTPTVATIGVGHWSFGQGSTTFRFNTHSFGHPRRVVLDQLSQFIPGNRSQPINIQAGEGVHSFTPYTVRKRIYATGWDGDFRLRADLAGAMRVDRLANLESVVRSDPLPRAGIEAAPRVALAREADIPDETLEAQQAARSAGLDAPLSPVGSARAAAIRAASPAQSPFTPSSRPFASPSRPASAPVRYPAYYLRWRCR